MGDMADFYINQEMDNDHFPDYGRGYGGRNSSDPLYYHMGIAYSSILKESNKAKLFKLTRIHDNQEVWIPNSIVKQHNPKRKTMFVHGKTFKSILTNNNPADDFADLIEPKKYRVVVESYDPKGNGPIKTEREFEDWVHDGKLVCPIDGVVEDWAYTYFDKGYYKIISIEEIEE